MGRVAIVLWVALLVTAATYGGGGMQSGINAERLDRIAVDSKAIPASGVWGNYLKTPDDMVPRMSVQFDDMGTRPDHDAMALEFLKRGIPVSIGVNAWGVAADDSLQIANILGYEKLYGTEVEWFQHTNGNATPDRVWSGGNRPGNPGPRSTNYITANSIATSDWRYYSAWKRSDWIAELDPTPIIRLTGERLSNIDGQHKAQAKT